MIFDYGLASHGKGGGHGGPQADGGKGSGERYLNHLYTIKKWHPKQEGIQIAEYITPTAHLMNSSPTRSINIFKIETNQGSVT